MDEIYTTSEKVTDTLDNGVIENVQIAPVGEYVGSDAKGNPVPEKLTAESLQALADSLNATDTEVLADIDHGAAKAGVEKDTKAAGWFTRFIVDPLRGLFATLKLTKHGKELIQNREYRYISPTFSLDEDGKPVKLHTASLTNLPAFAGFIDPVLNTEAQNISEDKEKIKMEMTKEELVTLIKDTVLALNSCASEEKKEEVENTEPEKKEEEACNTETSEEKKEEVCEACSAAKAEVTNSETETKAEEQKEEVKEEVKEETKEEAKPEEKKEEEKKEEVIKIEALNSAPTALGDVSGKSAWMNLHGDAFWKYLAEHPEIKS